MGYRGIETTTLHFSNKDEQKIFIEKLFNKITI